ncbi:uncharacterized protein [Henckelia pumila]|uniref:uncharacterized protein isoform X2 n=1 Tax=Henckelia pumila TaxID=405737 RepID=UPI003C6E0067
MFRRGQTMTKPAVAPRDLGIAWGDDSRFWNWTSHTDSRFPEVAELKRVWWLDILGKIKTRLLFPETTYTAFLVFKLADGASCLDEINASIKFVDDHEEDGHVQVQQLATTVQLQSTNYAMTIGSVAAVQRRSDGWMEVEIGNFRFQDGYRGEVEARLVETTNTKMKTGLIIESIEFRPEATLVPNNYLRKRKGEDKEKEKTFLVASKELQIAWGDNSNYWKWTSHVNSRFPEVAELKHVWWLDIRGKIKTTLLSPETTYAAFLVFKLGDGASCLEVAKAIIRFVNEEQDDQHAERLAKTVHLQAPNDAIGRVAVQRRDGWMEVELGNFSFEHGYQGEIEAQVLETTGTKVKTGLIIEGIEFRSVYAEAIHVPSNNVIPHEFQQVDAEATHVPTNNVIPHEFQQVHAEATSVHNKNITYRMRVWLQSLCSCPCVCS